MPNNNNNNIEFPSKWDNSSINAVTFYDRCKEFVDSEENFYELTKTSLFYYIFAIAVTCYVVVVNSILFYNYKNYMFKRQCRVYYICLMIGGLEIIGDSFFLGVFYENYPCFIHQIITSVAYPLYYVSIALIIIKYFKYYYKSQIAYFSNLLEFADASNKDKILNKRFFFKIFYTKITSKIALKVLFCYITLNFIYSVILSIFDKSTYSNGFCGTGIKFLPQVALIFTFLFIFLPLSLIEALKFDDKFRMKKTIIIFSILHIIYYVCYFYESSHPNITCTEIIQYVPPGFFVITSIITSTSLLTLSMLSDIIHINKQNKNLKSTYKGMLEFLEDKIQFREFGEFCRNENCVENILFYQEYWKYKRLFNKTERYSINDPLRSQEMLDQTSSVITSKIFDNNFSRATVLSESHLNENSSVKASTILTGGSSKNINNNKNLIETVEKEAKTFAENFIGGKAIYEINIQHHIITSINEKLEFLMDEHELSIEEKIDEYYILFDNAYKEVTNNIYLNSYSNYVHQKNKENTDSNKSRESKISNLC